MAEEKWHKKPPENGFYWAYNETNEKMEIFELDISGDAPTTEYWANACGDDRPYDSHELEGPFYGPLQIPQDRKDVFEE